MIGRFSAARSVAAAALALCLGFGGSPAQAADMARPAIIGFSEDGRFVAFEEYGIQDGSGYPYANLYVIDVAANDWVQGAPVRVVIDDSQHDPEVLWTQGVPMVREEVRRQAAAVLDRHGIIPGNTGTTLVYHPHSDLDVSPHAASFSIAAAYTTGFMPERNVLTLTERPATSAYCEKFDLGPHVVLTLELAREGEAPQVLQEDSRLPDSRNCPTSYRIHSVVAYALDVVDQSQCCGSAYALLVLVGMAQLGFEGPDWRYMGITTIVPPFY
jgi:predicted secreted protein